jgi:16S rRNA G966 N2-methylase RsmD
VQAAQKPLAGEKFDLILCDPPWAALEAAWTVLEGWIVELCLEPAGRLVVEHPASECRALRGATLLQTRAWGDTAMSIFSRSLSV